MDILDSAQKQINDAANQIDPQAVSSSSPPPEPSPTPITPSPEPPAPVVPPSVEPAAGLPKPEEPPKLKEEALLPEKSEVTPTPEPVAPPVTSPAPPPFAPIDVPDSKPTEPVRSTTFGAPPQKEPPAPQSTPASPPKKNGFSRGVLLAGLLLLLVALPIGIYYVSQQQQQITEQRSKAACPNGYAFCGGCVNSCQYITTKTCSQIIAERCGGGSAPTATPPPASGGGGGGSTQGLQDDKNSGCCSRTDQCVTWFGSVSTCTNPNGACASGKQCRGGGGGGCHSCLQTDCNVAGCGGQTCNAGCPTKCGNGVCEVNASPSETYQNCPADCKPPAPAGCGANGTACCDPFSTGGKICNTGLYCNTATGKCQTTAPGNLCQSGATAGTKCAVFTCGSKCNNGNQCNLNEQIVDCSGASLGGQCGQIDFLDTANNYCGVQSQNCGGSCTGGGGGGGGPTPTPVPPGAQCVRIRIYKGTAAIDPTTLKPGDSVALAVAGTGASKGRIRVNGGTFTETTTKNATGEFTTPFTVPSGITSFVVEAEVFGANGQWQ